MLRQNDGRPPIAECGYRASRRATFDVWFKVVAGAVVTLMALVLFFNFRRVELVGRPESFAKICFAVRGTAQHRQLISGIRLNWWRRLNPITLPACTLQACAHAMTTSSFTSQSSVNSSPTFLRLIVRELLRLKISKSMSESGCSSPRP